MSRRSNRRGFTLTEVAIVLGAMGLVLGAIWAVATAVWSNSQNQRLSQQIITVSQNIREYYMNMGKITAPGTTNGCASGTEITAVLDAQQRRLIPIEMRRDPQADGTTDIHHALGGAFSVICRENGGAFTIRLRGLKKENCMRLLMQFPFLVPEVGVKKITTPGGGEKSFNLATYAQEPVEGLPMTLATATNWCSNSVSNEVSLDFKLRN